MLGQKLPLCMFDIVYINWIWCNQFGGLARFFTAYPHTPKCKYSETVILDWNNVSEYPLSIYFLPIFLARSHRKLMSSQSWHPPLSQNFRIPWIRVWPHGQYNHSIWHNNYLFYFCKIAFIDQGSQIKTEGVQPEVFMWLEVNKGNLQK